MIERVTTTSGYQHVDVEALLKENVKLRAEISKLKAKLKKRSKKAK